MFIKIVRHKTDNIPYREAFHECEGFSLINNKGVKTLTLNPHLGEPSRLTFDVDPKYEEVYIMNNDGKTIDYYIWAKEDDLDEKDPIGL